MPETAQPSAPAVAGAASLTMAMEGTVAVLSLGYAPYNLMDEEWAYADSRSANAPGCTAIGLNLLFRACTVIRILHGVNPPWMQTGQRAVYSGNKLADCQFSSEEKEKIVGTR